MSKKTPVNKPKKSRRRLKRSVRRSLAAVLMITAIAVAAIPIPDNYAADGGDGGGVSGGNGGDAADSGDRDPHNDLIYTEPDKTKDFELLTKTEEDKINQWDPDSHTEDDIFTAYGKGELFASMAITGLDGDYDLSWRFMYYPETFSGVKRGVVCKYNSSFREESVDLTMSLINSYYTREESEIISWFETGIDPQNKVDGNAKPREKIIYSYNNYSMGVELEPEQAYFVDNYYKQQFDNFIALCKDYDEKKKAYDEAKKAYDEDKAAYEADPDNNDNPGNPPQEPQVPGDFEVIPYDYFTRGMNTIEITSEMLQYYSHFDRMLNSFPAGYNWVQVYNGRPATLDKDGKPIPSPSRVYVAKHDTRKDIQGECDKYGFLIKDMSDIIMYAIGNGAFKDVTSVTQLNIPDQMRYIGDHAFEGATLLEEINLKNVLQVGNRAFKGCTHLENVKMVTGVRSIGAECFQGTDITSIDLPDTIAVIGYGAFYNCRRLTKVNMADCRGDGSTGCEIKDFAFYNCYALTDINMSGANGNISKMGKGVFAVDPGDDSQLSVTLPETVTSIGDYLFAGRIGLQSVVFPRSYGTGQSNGENAKIPDNTFHKCYNIGYIEFPADAKNLYVGGYVTYESKILFSDITNRDFYVRGPEKKDNTQYAEPRKCTWDAETAVSKIVPYLFMRDGKEYYEVSNGEYLLSIRKNDDGSTGTLTDCTFKPNHEGSSTNIDLEIPAVVGDTNVVSIDPDCFSQKEFNDEVKSLTIQDHSVSLIGDGVFKAWPKLETVYIGDSVTSIGNEAFKDCNMLKEVTFKTPADGDFTKLKFGANAFDITNSYYGKLIFHGDIVEGYAPFVWAMDPSHKINSKGVRICYQSLSPTYMTVMYDESTGKVTLLDYLKYDQLNKMPVSVPGLPYANHNEEMEAYYYELADTGAYNNERVAFAAEFESVKNDPKKLEDLYNNIWLYGPWVNDTFCKNWRDYLPQSGSEGNEQASSGMFDWLFKPIVAQAAENPIPYYSYTVSNDVRKYAYSVLDNFENPVSPRPAHLSNTSEELAWINSTLNLVVPVAVKSIDVANFMDFDANPGNEASFSAYFNYLKKDSLIDKSAYDMYADKTLGDEDENTKVIPGLFSGYYTDYSSNYASDHGLYETKTRGNDRLLSITLSGVEYLPDYAFDSCERLQYVDLGSNCEDIGIAPFRGCYKLTNVNFNDNPKYTAQNGIVYSRSNGNVSTIEECLAARGNGVGSAKVPEVEGVDLDWSNITTIKPGAFQDCDYVSTISLDDAKTLTEIPKDCFKDCDHLNVISLPETINDIESGAFAYVPQLSSLFIPGREVFISADAFAECDKVLTIIYTFEDSSARRYAETYGSKYNLDYEKYNKWNVFFLDIDGTQVGDVQFVEEGEYVEVIPDFPSRDGYTYTGWIDQEGRTPNEARIYANTWFVAQGYSSNGMIDGVHYTVDFYCQICGEQIGTTRYVLPGEAAEPPMIFPDHDHEGYTFVKWSSDEYKNVQKNLIIMAMFSGSGADGPNIPGGNNSSGGSTSNRGSNNSTNNSNNNNNNNGNSSTSATSTSASATGKYTVTVVNGSGSGTYDAGTTVIIAANTPATGKVFQKWTTESQGVTLASVSLPATTFVMPANNVTVTANYVDGTITAGTATSGITGNGNNGTNGNNGNGSTRVDILKPGISNKDLATANVNGSTDNFVVKITETDEATQAVINALTNKYGSLDNILYYAMDISLYDSTGTTKITNTAGLSVDITIPIPDALIVYGGNNMAGAVVSDQLEDLSERFTTINGVPCISFTATHFSPYTIYVNTQNLSEGLLDSTPKTGDPIHPKWFLSLGLACLSIILFMKKDKKPVKVKPA